MYKIYTIISIVLLILLNFPQCLDAQVLAFPGAEGHGRYTTGGREGVVYHVTKLTDDGTKGTLRFGLNMREPRIIVFDVAGTIHLKSKMGTQNDDVTILGQSSPGGICIADYPFVINSNNVIIRFLRFRPGDVSGEEPDGLGGMDCSNVMIDHCSVSWSVDECLSVYGMTNSTVQWCIASEALRVSTHGKGTHGYGGNWGGNHATYHHNLIAHCESRTPRLGPRPSTQENELVDIRNNVFYNWAGNGCYGGEGQNVNLVNNYYKPGPATDQASAIVKYRIAALGIRTASYVTSYPAFAPMLHTWGDFYIDGNVIVGNSEVTNDNWTKGVYAQTSNGSGNDNTWTQETRDTIRLSEPLDDANITTYTAQDAYEQVLGYVGCCLYRDLVDERILDDVKNKKATFTASGNKPGYINTQNDVLLTGQTTPWPELPFDDTRIMDDTDEDGIPDDWEDRMGLDPTDASDAMKKNAAGYLYYEVYMNNLVSAITRGQQDYAPIETKISSLANDNNYLYTEGGMLKLSNLVGKTQLQVFRVDGSCIAMVQNVERNYSLSLSNGLYIVKLQDERGSSIRKIMIKN